AAGRFGAVRNPVRVYAWLEAGVAASALALPAALLAARWALVALTGDQPAPPGAGEGAQSVLLFLLAFALLLVPTGLMGATLPLLSRYVVRSDAEVGGRVGLLYAMNTAGAVAGALAAGFVFVPAVGLFATVLIGAAANGLVFIGARRLARRAPAQDEAAPARLALWPSSQGRWVLPAILMSGAAAFTYEVLWTRLLTHLFGGTIYAFTIMLATVLAGIAAGGWLGGRLAASPARASLAFAGAQAATALAAGLTYLLMQHWVPGEAGLAAAAAYAALIMAPPALCIGATYPLAVRVLARDARSIVADTALVYSWNTAGAIAGALLAGLVLLPAIGFAGTGRLAVAVNLGLAVWALAWAAPPRVAAVAGAGALVAVLLFQPGRPDATLYAAARGAEGREVYFGVGRSASVLVREADGVFEMSSDGLPEASIFRRGAPPAKHSQHWLVLLPSTARPDARTMLMVGLGGGVALEAAPPSLERIDVIEIEPQIAAANAAIAADRRHDPLADPRVRVVVNDARAALERTAARYDLIISQPSHPWTAGAANLYTREFIALAASRLTPGGVYLQWINAQYVDAPLLSSLAGTVAAEFDTVELFQPTPGVLLFLASDAPLALTARFAVAPPSLRRFFARFGLASADDLRAAWALDDEGVRALARRAPINTDDRNRLAARSRARGDGLTLAELDAVLAPSDPLAVAPAGAMGDPAYLAEQLMRGGFRRRAERLADSRADPVEAALMTAAALNVLGRRGDALSALEQIPGVARDDPRVADLRLRLVFAGAAARAPAADAGAISPASRAVVEGWALAAQGRWAQLRALDDRLTEVPPTHALAPVALRLRADWRLAFAQRAGERAFGVEALALLDQSLARYWNANLYILRAGAAVIAGDDAALTESAWAAAHSVERRLKPGPGGGAARGF
ncbi:MAG: fused MFS/spermidine synthase, partial [Caulobacterales bacterium]|nr:fused MFS/spermidine synthase [Caulobacterales bacterium]